jgi:septal ring-binding cell division protein DamX
VSQQEQPPIEEDYSSDSGGLMSRLSSWMVTLVVCSTSAFLTAGLINSFTEASQNVVNDKKRKSFAVGVSYDLPDRKQSQLAYIPEAPETPIAPAPSDLEEEIITLKHVVTNTDIEQKPLAHEVVSKVYKQPKPYIPEPVAKIRKPAKKLAKNIPAQNFLGTQTQHLINKAYSTSPPAYANRRTVAELSPLKMDFHLQFIPTELPKLSAKNLLAQRVEAGEILMKKPDGSYSIQIMRVSEATIGNMDNFIHEMGLTYMTDDLYMFPLKNQQYLIYYGNYDRAKTARRALTKLPDAIQKSGAFIIPLQTIRAKIIEHKPQRQIVTYRQNIS